MRNSLIIPTSVALISFVSATHGQWSSDSTLNTSVAGGSGDQAVPQLRPSNDGGAWVYFFDNSAGGYRPTVQRLSANGVPVFPGNGRTLANRTNTAIFAADADVDGAGNFYAVFDDDNGVTVQKVDPSGNLPWGAGGVQVPTLAGSLGNCIAVCADGTIVVAGAVNSILQLQRMDSSGSLIPGESWNLAEAGRAQTASDLISGGNAGDVILLWVRAEGTNPVTSRKGLKIQKWSSTHAPLWSGSGGAGTAIDVYTSSASPQRSIQNGYFPAALSDGNGGAVVAWYDTGSARNAWIQHVHAHGSLRFAQDGLAVSTVSSMTELRLSASAAYLPAVDQYVVAYERSNPLQSLYGLGAQRVDAAGNLLWGEGAGLDLIPLNSGNHKSFISVKAAPSNGAVIAWLDYQGANGPMFVKAARLGADGALTWGPNFLNVATASTNKGRLSMTHVVGSDMLISGWADGAAGAADIKVQNINMNGTIGPAECPGDVNNDGVVELGDLAQLLAAFGTQAGDPTFNASADLDQNGIVELSDLAMLLAVFGTSC